MHHRAVLAQETLCRAPSRARGRAPLTSLEEQCAVRQTRSIATSPTCSHSQEHIDKAVKGQIEDLKDYPEVVAELRMLQRGVHHHLDDLKQLRERRGGPTATDAIKRAGSSILGLAAGAIDLVRNEGLPKNLHDDYTAFSLAGVGYVMLHTTALALGDEEVADLANQHLRDYTKAVIRLNDIIPPAVVRFLHQEGLSPPGRPSGGEPQR